MLWTAGVFVFAVAIVCMVSLTHYPSWIWAVGPAIHAGSGLIPLVRGPRYVGVLLLFDAVVLLGAAQTGPKASVVFWCLHATYAASLFAIALWPLLEHQSALSKRDVLFPWAAALGIYLGFVVAFVRGALSLQAILGATSLIGAVLLVQSCQRAWTILRGAREAIIQRGFPVAEDVPADQRPSSGGGGAKH